MNQNQNSNSTDDIDVGSSKGSKAIIIIVATVLISVIVYFFILKPPASEEETVNNDELILEEGSGNVVTPTNSNSVDSFDTGIIDTSFTDDINYNAPRADSNLPALPELPEIPDDIKQQLNTATATKKEEIFTKDEVDAMIDEKMKEMMEKQMEMMSNLKKTNNTTTTTTDNYISGEDKEIEIEEHYYDSEGIPKTRRVKKKQPRTKKKVTKTSVDGVEFEEEIVEDDTSSGTDDLGLDTESDLEKQMTENELLEQKQKEERETIEKANKRQALQERKTAPMFSTTPNAKLVPQNSTPQEDAIILTYTNKAVKVEETTPDVTATQTTDLTKVIMQGKIIDAILETAIDTGLSSTVKAVVSRDVFAEEGKNILIPRGSKVIGTYETSIATGQTRVTINWNRIIRVDGMTLNIASIGTDRLGQAGVPGDLDNKYAQRLANSFLASVLTVGTSILTEKINDSAGITNVVSSLTGETTTTTGKASDYALVDAAEDFMDEAQDIVDSIAQQKPVIRIPQGERLTIMVTQDVTLPIFKRGI